MVIICCDLQTVKDLAMLLSKKIATALNKPEKYVTVSISRYAAV